MNIDLHKKSVVCVCVCVCFSFILLIRSWLLYVQRDSPGEGCLDFLLVRVAVTLMTLTNIQLLYIPFFCSL